MANSGVGSKTGLLTTLKEVTFFVAVYLYFAGFVYIYYFYDHFGISLRVVETPIYFFFVYSYNIVGNLGGMRWGDPEMQQSIWLSLLVVLLFAATLMVFRRDKRRNTARFAALVALFPLLNSLAFEAANVEAKKLRGGEIAKEITFVFKPDSSLPSPVKVVGNPPEGGTGGQTGGPAGEAPPPQPVETAETESLRLLLDANKRLEVQVIDGTIEHTRLYLIMETSTTYYALYQPRAAGEVYEGFVFEIPKAIVLFTMIQIPEPSR